MDGDLKVFQIEKISETNKHHNFLEELLPAYFIAFNMMKRLRHMFLL